MSVNSDNIYFHLGTVFTILLITISIFLVAIIWETSTSDLISNNKYFNDYGTDLQDISGSNVISICCAWGEEFADGELTFMIMNNNDDNTNDRESNILRNEAVYDAIKEWEQRIEGLAFREVQSRYDADIEIRFREGKSEAAGLTRNFFDRYGLISKSFVNINEREFPFKFNDDQIEHIAKHEIGHSLGLGHANFDSSLMATRVHYGSGSISNCEIQGVYEANHWKLSQEEGGTNNYIYHPTSKYIECNNKV